MEADNIEFIDVDIKTIKNENNDDPTGTTEEVDTVRHTKCGEIFTVNHFDFLLVCGFCENIYRSITKFGQHLRDKHIVPARLENEPITNDPDDFHAAFRDIFETSPTDEETLEENEEFDEAPEHSQSYVTVQNEQDSSEELKSDIVNIEEIEIIDDQTTSIVQSPRKNANATRDSSRKSTREKHELKDNPDLFCDICKQQYRIKMVFRHHSLEHINLPAAFRRDPYCSKCIFCDIEITDPKELLVHEKAHKEPLPYRCPKCPKRFNCFANKEEHGNVHTGARPFKCDRCSLSFAHSTNLNAHMKRIHLKIFPFSCHICGKKYPQQSELNGHIRRHTGEKPYQCEQCGKGFPLANLLSLHQKRHSNLRDKKCPHCPMTFFTSGALLNHKVKHSSARPFACEICGGTFKRRKALVLHTKLHKDTKEYVCNICGKEFAQPAGLYSHKKSHQ